MGLVSHCPQPMPIYFIYVNNAPMYVCVTKKKKNLVKYETVALTFACGPWVIYVTSFLPDEHNYLPIHFKTTLYMSELLRRWKIGKFQTVTLTSSTMLCMQHHPPPDKHLSQYILKFIYECLTLGKFKSDLDIWVWNLGFAHVTCQLIKVNKCAKVFQNPSTQGEPIIVQTSQSGWTQTRMHAHTCTKCDNYVKLSTSMLDNKNGWRICYIGKLVGRFSNKDQYYKQTDSSHSNLNI